MISPIFIVFETAHLFVKGHPAHGYSGNSACEKTAVIYGTVHRTPVQPSTD
jgi:hypothetical protein